MDPAQTAPRVLVVGCGGIGGVILSRLMEAGGNVTAVARREEIARVLRTRGPVLRDEKGERTVRGHLEVFVEPPPEGAYDFILLATPPNGVEAAARDTAHLLASGGPWWCCRTGCARSWWPGWWARTGCSAPSWPGARRPRRPASTSGPPRGLRGGSPLRRAGPEAGPVGGGAARGERGGLHGEPARRPVEQAGDQLRHLHPGHRGREQGGAAPPAPLRPAARHGGLHRGLPGGPRREREAGEGGLHGGPRVAHLEGVRAACAGLAQPRGPARGAPGHRRAVPAAALVHAGGHRAGPRAPRGLPQRRGGPARQGPRHPGAGEHAPARGRPRHGPARVDPRRGDTPPHLRADATPGSALTWGGHGERAPDHEADRRGHREARWQRGAHPDSRG
ncbi:hypothetical protein F0U59_44905 [Archangium gephyra]|nr:hypothetical protein F0U59_44905 [Archangium gephyra]